ncbi:uncharacterized protein SAPINGB_P002524 [Magnusiomyces paraingens]|uniref:Glycosyltransferase family 15 protein n=1 Tax=Magnusiomyces paraingens TaxID=2606893 RepID=A0A5E8BK44_9ASCO|nr:uncharacterized protein SAPINGB_P002524 [Saprochaete ingens]VVT49947.1 unnamed protein product [Saprochaete ingens]
MSRVTIRLIRFAVIAVLLVGLIYHLFTSDNAYTAYYGALLKNAPIPGIKSQQTLEQALQQPSELNTESTYVKANATFVTLARNQEIWDMIESIRAIEDRFNHKYKYDWVFLNDEEFDDRFKELTSKLISGNTYYEVIPHEHWSYPEWIDQTKAKEAREKMRKARIAYGGSESYRHMCRYESGFFWRHPFLNKYKYYWRVEPSIKIFCDINYDVFKYMEDHKLRYGFIISLYEYRGTIPTLWDTTVKFIKENPELLAKDNLMEFISKNGGKDYNLCHFWSNFEVADMDFWREEAYSKYFDYLDHQGGFFYERWGDAPVHTIGASLFLNKSEVHHFDDIGYKHDPVNSCPTLKKWRMDNKCVCNPDDHFAWQSYSCVPRFYKVAGLEIPVDTNRTKS